MICHEDVGMQAARMCPTGILHQFEVKPVIVIRIETGLAIIAALSHMLRDTGDVQAGRAWHDMIP